MCSLSTFTSLWQLARPRTCLVGVLSYVFGVELAHGEWNTETVLVGISMALMPAVANIHNSYTDVDEDAKNLPGRARLVSTVGMTQLRRMVFVGLFFVAAACSLLGWVALIVGVTGAALLLSYSAPPIRAKARPIAGLLVFSMVVSFPFFLGSITRPPSHGYNVDYIIDTASWFTFLTLLFIAKGFVKNVPDYEGDKASGVLTSASVMNSITRSAQVAKWVTWITFTIYPLIVMFTGSPNSFYIAALWTPIAAWHVSKLQRTTDPAELNTVLKWDMCITVGFLSTLALLPRCSEGATLAVILCLLVLVFADLVGADSRSSEHLPNPGTAESTIGEK